MELPLDRGLRGDGHGRRVVLGRLVGHRGVVEEEAEEGARGIALVDPRQPLLGQGAVAPARARIGRDRLETQIRYTGERRPVESDHAAVDGRAREDAELVAVLSEEIHEHGRLRDLREDLPVGRGETVEEGEHAGP